MQTKTVRDIMTPLSEYGTISVEATLFEAAMALDEAQKAYEQDSKVHRLRLITDENCQRRRENDVFSAV